MKIDEMKQAAKRETIRQERVSDLHSEAITKFESFFEIMKKSDSLWKEKRTKAIKSFVTTFIEYFKKHEFSIEQLGDTYDYGQLKATIENLTFNLSNINADSEKMYFTNQKDVREEIWIDLPVGCPHYFAWKDNLTIGKKDLFNFGGRPANECYKDFVRQLDTEDELSLLLKKLDINIQHFQESIDRFDSIELCIHRFGTDDTYTDFNTFIEAIE